MQKVLHETCQQYVARRLSEGWGIVWQSGCHLILSSPDGNILRPVDLRNDVETLRPNAAGDETNLTPHGETNNWECVDEAVADDLSTYVDAVVGDWLRDLYNLPAHSIGSGTINKITLYFRVASEDSSHRVKGAIKSNSTVTETAEKDPYTDFGDFTWGTYTNEWINNPADSQAWEWSDIDALQIGIALKRPSGGGVACTQVYVEVDYSPSVVVTPPTLALVITTYAPTVLTPRLVIPSTLALTLTEYAPVLHLKVTPTTLALILTFYAPTVLTPRLVIPSTLALILITYAPIIRICIIPPTLVLSLTTYAPNVILGTRVIPTTLALSLIAYIPLTLIPMRVFFRFAFVTTPFAITPTWVDISSDLVAFTTKRGRQHQLDRFEAGIATILLKNLHGNYWPGNEEGDYYPEVKLGKRVNIRVVYSATTYDEYTGFVRKWKPVWFSQEANLYPGMMLECVDLQRNLAKAKLNNAGYPLEKSGVRVGKVLTEVGWPAADRDIDTGKENMIATGALENVNPMEHLFKVQESELGTFFIKGNGYTVFHERGALEDLSSQATFGTGNLPIFDPEFSLDDDLLYNEVRLNRVGGTEQVYSDAASILAHSLRTLTRSGLLLTSDAIVYIYCLYLVARHHDAKMRIKSFTVKPQTPGYETTLWPLVLGLEIGQKITLVWTEADINGDYFIEGKEHSWDYREGVWVTKFQCSDAAQFYFEPDAADELLRPNAAGDETNIPGLVGKPTHWEAVLDSSTGTYVWHSSDGWARDLYNCDPLVIENVAVSKITVHALVMQEDYTGGTTGWAKAVCKSGDTVAEGDAVRPDDPGNWVDVSQEWALSPDTGLAWTEEEIIALQIGVSMIGGGLGDFWIRCMRVWVVVDYIPDW